MSAARGLSGRLANNAGRNNGIAVLQNAQSRLEKETSLFFKRPEAEVSFKIQRVERING
jgi:hypothetical protein